MHSTSTAHGVVIWRSVDQDSVAFIISIKIKKNICFSYNFSSFNQMLIMKRKFKQLHQISIKRTM